MKTKSLIVIAGICAFTSIAYAEEGKEAKKPKNEISPELLEKYDTDKDGKLSKEEKAEMKKAESEAKPKKEKKEKKEKEAEPEKAE